MGKFLVFSILLFFIACSPDEAEVKFQTRGAIYIPVEIYGKKYDFLFDTGAATTTFSDSLVRELGEKIRINKKDENRKLRIFERDNQLLTYKRYKNIIFRLAGIPVEADFVGEEGHDSNIIGMNIISQLHWLFDFDDSTVVISRKPVSLNQDDLECLTLSYITNGGATAGAICLQDSLYKYFVFDTGFHAPDENSGKMTMADYDLFIEVPAGDPEHVIDTLGNVGDMNYSFTHVSTGAKRMIFPELKLNGKAFSYMVAAFHEHITNNGDIWGNLTFGFIMNRFNHMQINPDLKEISLYRDKQRGEVYVDRIKTFYFESIKKFCLDNNIPFSSLKLKEEK